jgi:hypothetical protein
MSQSRPDRTFNRRRITTVGVRRRLASLRGPCFATPRPRERSSREGGRTETRKITGVLSAVVALLVLTGPAGADHGPVAFGEAHRDSLRVVSGVFVTHRAVGLRGVWLDKNVPCNQFRSLRVAAILDYSRGGTHRKMTRSKIGVVRNCAEGGPNFGFTIRARDTVPRPEGNHPHLGLACANGRWLPGSYSFTVRTTHRATKTSAFVTVLWENKGAC